MPEDRMTEFEKTITDPNITKFAPKRAQADVPIATLVVQVREQAQATLKLCDEMDKHIAASEGDVRKLGDLLIGVAARMK